MAEREWRAFPIYIFTTSDGEKFMLPTDRDLNSIDEQIQQAQSNLNRAKEKNSIDQVKLFEAQVEALMFNKERLVSTVEKLKPLSTKKDYHLSWPDFGEFTMAEEDSKDWIAGEPRVNEAQLSLNILGGRVRRDGIELTKEQVKSLDLQEAKKLWEEMKAMIYPNSERLPFLRLP